MNTFSQRLFAYLRLLRANRRIARAMRRGDSVLDFGPSSLNLMMVDACNLQCVMCGHDYKCRGSGDILTLDRIQAIYGHLDLSQIVDVMYGGGGEPFLNRELAAIAECTRQVHPSVQHTVITNMVAVDEGVLTRLLKCRVNFLVSINAASRETYNTVAGLDAFEQVVANVRTLVALRRAMKSKSHFAVSMILMKSNIEELPAFVRLAKELGVDEVKAMYVRVYPATCRDRQGSAGRIATEDSLFFHQTLSDRTIQEAERLAREQGITFSRPPLFLEAAAKTRDCSEPWRSMYINYDGKLFACAAGEIQFKHKIEQGQYDSGNILTHPAGEIWNNPFWQALRRTNALANRQEIVPECRCCGMSICWWGPGVERSHVMDWSLSERSDLRL